MIHRSRSWQISSRHARPPFFEPLETRRMLAAPVAGTPEFLFETAPHRVTIDFDQDVSGSLSSSDLHTESLTGGSSIATNLTYLTGNVASFAATGFTNGILPKGNYQSTIFADSVHNGTEFMTSDANVEYFFLPADANRDRVVNSDDFNATIGVNFGTSGKTFSQGNFNYDAAGWVNSDDFDIYAASFGSTQQATPGPGALNVSQGVGQNSLEWTAWPSMPADITGMRVQRSTDGQTFVNYAMLDASARSFIDDGDSDPNTSTAGLPPGSRFWYRVRAIGGATGGTSYTAKKAGTTVMTPPANVSASAVSSTEIDLTWTDTTDNETKFQIEVTPVGGGAPWIIDDVPANADGTASFTVNGLNPNTSYTFRVCSWGPAIESAWTLATSPVTTEPVSVLEAPTNLELSMLEFTTLRLSWSYAGSDHTGFNIYAAAGDGAMEFLQETGPTIRLVNLSNFEEGMPYAFVIRAFDDVEESADSNVATGNTRLQHATSVVVSQPAETELLVTWGGGSSFGEGWELERKIDDEPWEYVGSFTPGETTFSDTGILAGSHYEYRVRAFRADVYSLHNSGGMPTAITAPTNLGVNVVSAREANLTWNDNSSVETGFRVFFDKPGQSQTLDLAANTRGYTFTSLDPQTTYSFRVAAIRAGSLTVLSAATPVQVASTPAPPLPPPPAPGPFKVFLGGMSRGETSFTYVSGGLALHPHDAIPAGSPTAAVTWPGVISGTTNVYFDPNHYSYTWSNGYRVYWNDPDIDDVNGVPDFSPLHWDEDAGAYVGIIGLEDWPGELPAPDYDDWIWPVSVYGAGTSTIAVTTPDDFASESALPADTAALRVHRLDGAAIGSLTVDFHPLAGSAVRGGDYIIKDGATQIIPNPTTGQFSINFASGETDKTLTVEAADDLLDEPLDDVYLYPKGSTSYRLATPSTAPAKIASNDTATGDIDVLKVDHNAPGPELADAEEMNPGAFLPVNNDDDDYKGGSDAGQKNANGQPVIIDGEDDLLVLKVKKANPAAGEYRLETPAGGFRVFQNPNRTGLLNDWFDATHDRELYIEAPKRLIGTIKLSWRRDAKSQPKPGLDELKLTSFEWSGALNVPDYSIHRYTVISPPTGSKWIAAGMQHGTIKSGADSADAQIQWTQGKQIGKAVFQAHTSFIWDLGVNIVEVKIENPDNNNPPPFETGQQREDAQLEAAYYEDEAQRKHIHSGTDPNDPGLSWAAKVTLTGPGQNGERGLEEMYVGFIQNSQWTRWRGRYTHQQPNQPDRWLRHRNERAAKWYLDKSVVAGQSTKGKPYAYTLPETVFDDASANKKTEMLSAKDTPNFNIPVLWKKQEANSHLNRIESIWQFELYVSVSTSDKHNGANGVYTSRAWAKWHWDGSGNTQQGGQYAWTPDRNPGVIVDHQWQPLVSGSQPPVTSGTIANEIHNENLRWVPTGGA